MAQADSPNTTTLSRLSFASACALPPQALARLEAPTSATPSAYAIGPDAWVPVIEHPGRVASYVQNVLFRRKVKATAAEAIAYARKSIWHRERQAAEKRRHLEALQHPRYFLEAAE
jgi:hypothetical protein